MSPNNPVRQVPPMCPRYRWEHWGQRGEVTWQGQGPRARELRAMTWTRHSGWVCRLTAASQSSLVQLLILVKQIQNPPGGRAYPILQKRKWGLKSWKAMPTARAGPGLLTPHIGSGTGGLQGSGGGGWEPLRQNKNERVPTSMWALSRIPPSSVKGEIL